MLHIHKPPTMTDHPASSPNGLLFGYSGTATAPDPIRDCRGKSCCYIESYAKGQHLGIGPTTYISGLHPSEFSVELGGCFFYISFGKGFFEPAIYIQITYDLYIYQKRFIYKMKKLCIKIENGLYTDRFLISQKSCFDLKKSIL